MLLPLLGTAIHRWYYESSRTDLCFWINAPDDYFAGSRNERDFRRTPVGNSRGNVCVTGDCRGTRGRGSTEKNDCSKRFEARDIICPRTLSQLSLAVEKSSPSSSKTRPENDANITSLTQSDCITATVTGCRGEFLMKFCSSVERVFVSCNFGNRRTG